MVHANNRIDPLVAMFTWTAQESKTAINVLTSRVQKASFL